MSTIKFKTIARWPRPAVELGNENNESEDTHDTRAQAEAVARRLVHEGFGGDGTIFPIGVRVEPFVPEDEDLPYEIIDHGIQHSQFFQGCGVSHTRFGYCATGIGDTPGEAVDDALTGIADSGFLEQDKARNLIELIELSDEYKKCKASDISADAVLRKELGVGEDDDTPDIETYYYVSIRYNS